MSDSSKITRMEHWLALLKRGTDEHGIWPLAENAKPCVGSGLCCKTARCSIGAAKHGPGRECPSLVEKDGRYWCGEILDAAPDEAAWLRASLYVGAGCCMPLFNERRDQIIKLKKG